ncbi:DUF5330 domain-containing protein [Corticibacterium sp. UT-5YL-CI-8]|nr:DUF5330 domain-containing protein [Tianweitania sp. UT-5YL-CI-8]
MGFLLRTGFWFALVLLILPFDFGSSVAEGEKVSPIQTFFAARDAVSDISGICERQPDVCETGRTALQTIGVRARETARIAYELLDQQFGEKDKDISTGSVAVQPETQPADADVTARTDADLPETAPLPPR